jgi:hypothetical protein
MSRRGARARAGASSAFQAVLINLNRQDRPSP